VSYNSKSRHIILHKLSLLGEPAQIIRKEAAP